MGNFVLWLEELFLGKETDTTKIGLSEFKKKQTSVINAAKRKSIFVKRKPQELRLSELMRNGSSKTLQA
ncbi:MAG: hypothetical protein SPL73_02760 [Cyanobacteriota bacterium]|nr:hypothetical protein [Cyanobacteriota bacterium]MDY6358264.1 hypothetical protein [Cyanobacteriota bacterium]MDY6363791.1 hypothetical protein [Cyanobacteriota bacterium]MDY6382377.1 hypothetical protein [Cyanobacteriota bacterium]